MRCSLGAHSRFLHRTSRSFSVPRDSQEKLSPEIAEEKAQLLREGFGSWLPEDFAAFLYGCERYGRNDVAQIAKEVERPVDDVLQYAKVGDESARRWLSPSFVRLRGAALGAPLGNFHTCCSSR